MSPIHDHPHPLARQTVKLNLSGPAADIATGDLFVVEDWADRVLGQSWQVAGGNPTAMKYAVRSGFSALPMDNDVVYGKVRGLGHIVHVSELVDPTAEEPEGGALVEFRVTFGSAHTAPPLAHPDGWLTVEAPTETAARRTVHAAIGARWSSIYAPGDDHYPTAKVYPLGELHRLHAAEAAR